MTAPAQESYAAYGIRVGDMVYDLFVQMKP